MSIPSGERRGPEAFDGSVAASRTARSRTVRRAIRLLLWSGLVLLLIGFVLGFLAQGASVPATIVLSLGLVVESVGLVAYRLLFWASVYAKDRPVRAQRVRKSGP